MKIKLNLGEHELCTALGREKSHLYILLQYNVYKKISSVQRDRSLKYLCLLEHGIVLPCLQIDL